MDKIFSPLQVFFGTVIGGPFAALYFLKKNYDALDNAKASKKVLILAGIFFLFIAVIIPYLFMVTIPTETIQSQSFQIRMQGLGKILMVLTLAIPTYIALKHHDQNLQTKQLKKRSVGKVIIVSLSALLMTITLGFIIFFVIAALS